MTTTTPPPAVLPAPLPPTPPPPRIRLANAGVRYGSSFALLLLVAASPAADQIDFQPSPLGTILPSLTRQDPLSAALAQKRAQADLAASVRSDVAASVRSLRFTPSVERRRANVALLLNRVILTLCGGSADRFHIVQNLRQTIEEEMSLYGLKTLKRAMYGRAGPELLRARMLPFRHTD